MIGVGGLSDTSRSCIASACSLILIKAETHMQTTDVKAMGNQMKDRIFIYYIFTSATGVGWV